MKKTRFEYDPAFQTIVKYVDDAEVDRLSVSEADIDGLSFCLWAYLQDKRFSMHVEDVRPKTAV